MSEGDPECGRNPNAPRRLTLQGRFATWANLGASRAQDVGVTYVGKEEVDGCVGYCLDLDGALPRAPQLCLRPEQEKGTEQQIKRRMRNIEALDTCIDLSAMLGDPWRARRKLRQPADEKSGAFKVAQS